jgi:NAD(P)-dependent dehydrogenase (short-subunit alcohol dehydrogenase family)
LLNGGSLRILTGDTLHLQAQPAAGNRHSGLRDERSLVEPNRKRPKAAENTMTGTFGATSTTDEVLAGVDLSGKRILVTGASAGLGVETARALAARGAHVVGAARDLNKARRATEQVRAQATNGGGLELVELDLASLASVRACADALVAAGKPFDVVIANAGVMACPKSQTSDGFETQFGTNHLGHFVLVNRIAALFKPGSRLVNLSSAGHRYSDVDLEDPNFERTPYTEFGAYGRSKTANIQFAVEFDRRHKDRGVRATALHPGAIHTELARHMTPEAMAQLIASINASQPAGAPAFTFKTIPQGAATSVWAGVVAASDTVGGRYCEDCHVAELAEGQDIRGGVRAYALDPDRAQALWAKSEEMVGERF